MATQLKKNLLDKNTWLRGLCMLVFAVIYSIAEIVLVAVVVFQFVLKLFTGEVNERVGRFGQDLSTFIYQVLIYLTYNREEAPYPFADWPRGAPAAPKKKAAPRTRRKKAAKPVSDPLQQPTNDE